MRTFLSLIVVAALAQVARADEACPVPAGDNQVEAITKAMTGKSCGEASQLAEQCAYGASADVVIAGTATDICRKDFARNKADKKLFTTLTGRCQKKFRGMDGTMYISAQAFCVLDVAKLLSSLNKSADE